MMINALNLLWIVPLSAMSDALKWAKSFKITDDENIAQAIWRYHNTFNAAEDDKRDGGLTNG